MLPRSWGSPGKGSQDYDPLLESALPPTLSKDDCATAPEEEDDSDNDSDDDQDVKDARTKRLGETKGWLGYLRDFAIFIPFVFPRKDIKIQICLLICIITFTLERAIQAIIPYTLEIIADKVTSRVAPTRELLIFFALDLASCESGLIPIQNLSKIPVKQFSYQTLTNASFNHVMSQSFDFHSTHDSAEVMKAVEQGESLGLVLETVVFDIAPTIIDVVVACAIFYRKFNPTVAVILLVACIVYLMAQAFSTRTMTNDRRNMTRAERIQIRKTHQAIQGWQTVAYFNQFKREARNLAGAVSAHTAARTWYDKKKALLDALVELLVPTTFLALAYIIIQRIVSGDAPPGDFVFFLRYWDAIVYPLRYLINHIHWLANDFVDAERLLILLKTKPTVTDVPEAFPLAVRGGNIQFKDVSFMYDEGHYALNNISFTASTGQTFAFVGETGAGKSSVLKLLMRLHDITSGRITIADQDIQKVTLSSLRDVMSVVPQTTMFFNTSIIDNVRYARSSATDEEVFKACRAAAIHHTIMRYPDGYSTQVGERGVKLSGGEAQRLAIARALLRDSPIVLLDEATSAVDTVTEGKIKGALEKLKRGRTVIVVAHQLSTIVDADQILVLHEGQILEKGRHQELCELRGRYWDLWEQS
ncbi:P-loop containing nucleoside triphosphate hydrolase protein [Aureobasidium subglaciale]|nr:P-loop containing nucleoside triphosphate hydrolase protein [Aureobasidium subglaciale]